MKAVGRIVAAVSISVMVTAVAVAGGHLASPSVEAASIHSAHHHAHHHRTRHGDWSAHDRAVYAVSTLNAPLCSNNQQLSTVLWNQYNARLFNVLGSADVKGLYFIQVKTLSGSQVGVYSYQFGTKLPGGVDSFHCVSEASSTVTSDWKAKASKFIAQFASTYPKS